MTNLKSGNKHMHGFVKSKEIRERERKEGWTAPVHILFGNCNQSLKL